MTKSITIALAMLMLSAVTAAAQCVYTVTGQVTSNNQVVNNQAVVFTWNNGLDTVFTNPNGVYMFNYYGSCDSSMVFTAQAAGCGVLNSVTVTVPLNQTVNLPLTLCNSQVSCTTNVQVSTVGNTVQYSWTGAALGGATPVSVMWDYGDGSMSNNYPNGGSHLYPNPGVYTLCAMVEWSNGCTSMDCESVSIGVNTLDSCLVSVNTNVSGNTVTYSWTGISSDGSAVQSITWYTNNGIALGSSPSGGSYTFSPGTYTICANVTWAGGCSNIDCSNVTIGNQQTGICGCVNYVDDNNDTIPVGCGTAYLIQYDSSSNATIIVDSTNITPNGYCFYGNLFGSYTVLAVPCGSNGGSLLPLMPTYLGNVLVWQDANTVPWGMNNYVANCITLQNGQNSQGPAQIGGTILWGDDKAPGDPLVGANVLLLDSNGDPIEFAVTDIEGFYSFTALPYGTYQIYPEIPGYNTYPSFVTLSAENPDVEVDNFYIGFGIIATAGVEESIIQVGGLYPNPAADVAVLSLTSKEAGFGKLNITDITGKTIQSSSVNIAQGQQNISLNLQDITAGVYTVTLTLHGQQMHVKLIKR